MTRLLVVGLLAGLTFPVTATAESLARVTFSTRCYWRAEAAAGMVNGVREIRIGDIDGVDIVEVTFDPSATSLSAIVAVLKESEVFGAVVVTSDSDERMARAALEPGEIVRTSREPSFTDSKHALRTRHPALWKLGLTERQAIVLNSWAFFGGPMPDILTEEQKAGLRSLRRVAQ